LQWWGEAERGGGERGRGQRQRETETERDRDRDRERRKGGVNGPWPEWEARDFDIKKDIIIYQKETYF